MVVGVFGEKHSYFEFGSIEDHFKYRQAVMEAYPCGHYPVFEGHEREVRCESLKIQYGFWLQGQKTGCALKRTHPEKSR